MSFVEKYYPQIVNTAGAAAVISGGMMSAWGGAIIKNTLEGTAADSVSSRYVKHEAVTQMQAIIDSRIDAQQKGIQKALDNGDPEIRIDLGTNTITIQREKIDQNFNRASEAEKTVRYVLGTVFALSGLGLMGYGARTLREANKQRKTAITSTGPA
jgi:hypothetical protein